MKKAAQIQTQVFVYVIAMIIFSLILLYGFNALRGFGEKTEQIVGIQLKTDLTSTVKAIATDFGSVKRKTFQVGGNTQQVCFVQSHKGQPNAAILSNLLVRDSVEDKSGHNTFLLSTTLEDSFDIGSINTSDNGYLCFPARGGKIDVEFRGKGDHAFIAKIPTP